MSTTNRKPKQEYSIQTVANALRLLQVFDDEGELGVTELSRRLGLHKNNVFRLLATLELQGYVEQSANERYRLGLRSLELGQAFSRSRSLLQEARASLAKLATTSGECAHVCTLRDFEVAHLDGECAEQLVGACLRIGRRLPVHATAAGKILIGCADDSMREAYDRSVVAGSDLTAMTERTITDAQKFFEHVRTASVRGFALDVEECAPGLSCAAAPVHDKTGAVVAALSVSGPACRMGEERLLSEVAPAVMASAERLSRALGYAP